MKKVLGRSLITFALIIGVSLPMMADTIRLKDGSVIRGQIVGFKNEQFTILVGGGTRGRKSRITVYMEDVDSIEFDSSTGANTSEDTNTTSSQPPYQPPTTNQPTNNQPTNSQPTNNQPTNNQTGSQPPATGQPTSGNNPTFFQVKVSVRADNASNGWTNSGLVVRRGQRLRINATGRINTGNNRTSTPDGMPNVPDRDKLMRNQPTAGLIAVIGDDNDDFIFVGRALDFVAKRDGVLFLGVNEGNLSDNSGTFEVVIEAETMSGKP